MSDRLCGTCAHWTKPSERDDFRTPIASRYGDIDDYEAAEAEVEAADKLLGECHGVPHYPMVTQLPTPPAAVIDGSDYFAQLYTGADFFCALWKERG